ncbi:hypothetical protein [Actinomadura spongiicola]|uniref:hypothetical protein n=1 Tax=Actinomadura spongiicola TaxID=2303421 RepID=UPI0011C1990A|nr:hypothetical protein [Actinomadura spongiicola]
MPTDRRRPARNLQRRVRRRQAVTGESYMTAAAAVEAEGELGERYLSDHSVPSDLAAAVRAAGLIPLEAFTMSSGAAWWCRCRWCGQVVDVKPVSDVRQPPRRHPNILNTERHTAGRCTRPAPAPVLIPPNAALAPGVAALPGNGGMGPLMAMTRCSPPTSRAPAMPEPLDSDASRPN